MDYRVIKPQDLQLHSTDVRRSIVTVAQDILFSYQNLGVVELLREFASPVCSRWDL